MKRFHWFWALCLFVVCVRASGIDSWTDGVIREAETSMWFVGADAIVANLEGETQADVVLVVRVGVGSRVKFSRLVVDFTRSDLVLTSSEFRTQSGSFIRYGGVESDVLHISGSVVRFPVSFDLYAGFAYGCPSCDGVLGAGMGSPLWMRWPNITVTTGLFWLGGRADFPDHEQVACNVASQELCIATADVRGGRMDEAGVEVRLAPHGTKTRLPGPLFAKWAFGLSVDRNPSPGDWPDLELDFYTKDGGRARVVIPSSDLVVSTGLFDDMVLMVEDWDQPYIRLGFSAWQSFQAHINAADRVVGINTWETQLDYSWMSLLTALGALFIIMVWKTTVTPYSLYEVRQSLVNWLKNAPKAATTVIRRGGERVQLSPGIASDFDQEIHPHIIEWKRYENTIRSVIEIVTPILTLWVYFSPIARAAMRGEPVLDIFLFVLLLVLGVGAFVGVAAFWLSERIGKARERVMYPRIFFGLQPLMKWPVLKTVGVGERFREWPQQTRAAFARLAVMRSYIVETSAAIAFLLLVSETRADTLGGVITCAASLFIICNSIHYTLISLTLAATQYFSFAWVAVTGAKLLASLGLVILLAQSVVVPFVRRSFNVDGGVSSGISYLVVAITFPLTTYLSVRTVRQHRAYIRGAKK